MPFIFEMIMKHLEAHQALEAIEVMDDMNISMELFRENFLELLTPDKEKRFTDLSTKSKTAFTRIYN